MKVNFLEKVIAKNIIQEMYLKISKDFLNY